MRILFISKHKPPHIGGVEKHIREISEELKKKDYVVTTISEEDIKQPHIKIIGLLYIWFWFLKNIKVLYKTDIIHIHDVFIWYLPFCFLLPFKKIFITFHGWEGKYPIPIYNILNKKVANYLCNGSIAVGKYIEKYYKIKPDYIIHGAVRKLGQDYGRQTKIKNTVVWLGRQEKDTGYFEFQKWLKKQREKYKVKYITNDPNPEKYLKTAEYCVPSGYLSYLEAKNANCKILTFSHNKLKEDYWNEIMSIKKIPTWSKICEVYLKLWRK
ncbi:MAG: hypothetical protein QY322_01185 [bacterium]|nr:MAG: hypothetical protein QY322_01185 [bacterium]